MSGDAIYHPAVCWSIVRQDGQMVLGTSLDVDLVVTATGYAGTYKATSFGISASNTKSNTDLSVDNLEIKSILASSGVQASDLEAGLYDNAAVVVFLTDWTAPSTAKIIKSGTLGQSIRNFEGSYTEEVRGIAQQLTQNLIETVSITCRANLGDSRCKVVLTPYTASGTVDAVSSQDSFTDAGLSQAGPIVEYLDDIGTIVPSLPFQVPTVPPQGGTFVSNGSVTYADGTALSQVTTPTAAGQYSVDAEGLYIFSGYDTGAKVFINYNYTYGYFDNGTVTWDSGANAGYTMQVRQFTPAASGTPATVQLFMPMVNVIASGDTYTIVAGCKRDLGTCRDRFNNLNNMRAEPYTPGEDALRRVLT